MTEVYVEIGKTRTVACAWDWPGWCRYGKTAEIAVQALRDTEPRYRLIATQAGLTFAPQALVVVTTLQGNGNSDWSPTLITERDTAPYSLTEAERGVRLLQAAWSLLDDVVARSVSTLRKGPRGGGRERDEVFAHVVEVERIYARKVGVRQPPFAITDMLARAELRDLISAVLGTASDGAPLAPNGWPPAYAVRHFAWHAIDHLWEIEDRQV